VALYRQRMALRDIQGGAAPRRKDASAIDQQLRLAGLRAERDEIVRRGHSHAIDEATQGRLVREIDLEEARYSAQPTT
jgi:hypothetical protein